MLTEEEVVISLSCVPVCLSLVNRAEMKNEADSQCDFYTCSCFTSDHIFLQDFRLHVRFVSEQQFTLDYQTVSVGDVHNSQGTRGDTGALCLRVWFDMTYCPQLLRRLGCVTDQQFADVLKEVGGVCGCVCVCLFVCYYYTLGTTEIILDHTDHDNDNGFVDR